MSGQAAPRLLAVHQGFDLYGSGRVFLQSLRALRARFPAGRLTAVLPGDGPLRAPVEAVADRLEIVDLLVPRKSDLRRGGRDFLRSPATRVRRAAGMIAEHDLLWVNTILPLDFLLAARFARAPALVHVHEAPVGLERWIFGAVLAACGAFPIFNSRASAAAFRLVSRRRAAIVHDGAADPGSPPAPAGEGLPGRPLRILALGRLSPRKGLTLLVEAVARLAPEERSRVRVRIAGDEFDPGLGHRETLLRAISRSGLAQGVGVEAFAADPAPLHRWADLLIVPSLQSESLGLVAVEAMSHARPVIAAAHSGLLEVVEDGSTGYTFPTGDVAALADRIRRYLVEPALLARHGAAGRRRFLERFDERDYLERIGELAAQVLEGRPPEVCRSYPDAVRSDTLVSAMHEPAAPAGEPDAFDLARFVLAQASTYAQAVSELRAGRKRSHWMWFVFPQCAGLGVSPTSRRYAIGSLAEARAYLAHPVLGPRLIECTAIVNRLEGRTAREIFGTPDDVKFRSSMTLFELASGPGSEFTTALETYFGGVRDALTRERVQSGH